MLCIMCILQCRSTSNQTPGILEKKSTIQLCVSGIESKLYW